MGKRFRYSCSYHHFIKANNWFYRLFDGSH
ncbi:MAG: DUF1655 domain-containing protein [Pyrinomonadaceae bacterium]